MRPHPTKDELSEFLLGKLGPDDVESVAGHLEKCQPCQATIHALDAHSDTLIAKLRGQAPPPVPPAAQRVVEKIAAAGPHPAKPSAAAADVSAASLASVGGKPASVTREQFIAAMTTAGVMDAEDWKHLEASTPSLAQAADATTLAQALIAAGTLTKFQAMHILQGKAKSLVLGEYVLLDRLGAGGMGQVLKARHRRMKRIAAVKILAPSLLKTPDAVRRFQREVEAAAKLVHPNIVIAHDAGQAGNVHYLVMEYVAGSDLAARVKKDGPLSVPLAIDYIRQAAGGLAFAHSQGVVHRDIKPANLLVDQQGVVKILDMGLARLEGDAASRASEDGLTQSGQVMGTVDYMAPEQALDTRKADARADVYSLGCTLYRLLVGANLYEGETLVQKLLAHRETPIPSLRAARKDVPAALDTVFQRMVAKKPEDRPTMPELVQILEAIAKGVPAPAAKAARSAPVGAPQALKPIAVAGKRALKPAQAAQPPRWRTPQVLAPAGAAGFFVLLLAVWVIVRGRDNQPIAKIEVPAGATVEVKNTAEIPADKPAKAAAAGVSREAAPAGPASSGTSGATPALAKAPFDAQQAHAYQTAWAQYLGMAVESTNQAGIPLILIPSGEYLMGTSPEEVEVAVAMLEAAAPGSAAHFRTVRLPREQPQHRVVLTHPFLLGKTEVTVGQFRKFVAATGYKTDAERVGCGNGSEKAFSDKVPVKNRGLSWQSPGFDGLTDEMPVTQVSWNDACAFCNWLTAEEHLVPWYRTDGLGNWLIASEATGYRLPTEAEWEYACRAGTSGQFFCGDSPKVLEDFGWYTQNARSRLQPVAAKRANPFGLYDMLGNVREWCQDSMTDNYQKSETIDPVVLPATGYRVARGGNVGYYATDARCAARAYSDIFWRNTFDGFRVARPLTVAAANSGEALNSPVPMPAPAVKTKQPAASPQPAEKLAEPAFQGWMRSVADLPAEQQVEAVVKKLQELNPGFNGKAISKIEQGVVIELRLASDKLADISPVRALAGLRILACEGCTPLTDLSPLQGLRLTHLNVERSKVADLTPVVGMPLEDVRCDHTLITDLGPLRAMPLRHLQFSDTPVSDLTPLKGSVVGSLCFNNTKVTDLSPLSGSRLHSLQCESTAISDLSPLKGLALKDLKCGDTPVADLSPLAGMPLTRLECHGAQVKDLSPLRGLPLTSLNCGKTPVSDLAPLRGLRLTYFSCDGAPVTDLSPLAGMPLESLYCNGTQVADLSPLRDMPLKQLNCSMSRVADLSPLEACRSLKLVQATGTKVTDVSALQRALPNCKFEY